MNQRFSSGMDLNLRLIGGVSETRFDRERTSSFQSDEFVVHRQTFGRLDIGQDSRPSDNHKIHLYHQDI